MTLEQANHYIKQHSISRQKRPQFHLTAPVGWLNDPNGFSHFKGETHLFYQFNPYDTKWGPMHWGHAKSKDLVVWEDLPAVIAPQDPYDKAGCFSGSAISKGDENFLIYTGVSQIEIDGQLVNRQQQCLAIGDGLNYQKYQHNPVISYDDLPSDFSKEHFRDPKVWEEDGRYYLVAGNLNAEQHGQVLLFESVDLFNWQYRGVLAEDTTKEYGRMWECPDFFALGNRHVLICSPQHMRAKGLEFHNGHNALYFAGTYEPDKIAFDKGQGHSLDYGLDFYAPQTTLLPDGRRIMVGWLKSWDSVSTLEELEWQGMMTLPRELSWKGERLIQTPIKELENYRTNPLQLTETISGAWASPDLKGRLLDLSLTLKGEEYERFTIDLAANQDFWTTFIYRPKEGTLSVDRTYSGLSMDHNCQRTMAVAKQQDIRLRFIMDTHSIELFVNDGEQVMSLEIETPLEASDIRLTCQGTCQMDIEKYDLSF